MFGLGKYGNGIGLHRALRFMDAANIPRDFFADRSIVVTGSNGKGSTTRIIASLLESQFEQVGCFTSPHLVDLTERIEINGERISAEAFNRYKAFVLAFNDQLKDDSMGAFELLFDVALLWFYERDVDCVVWEAGIGGRYDPTRTLGAPISALTSLDLEHTELLGPTLELIAYDKLDVTRVNGETVISSSVKEHLYERLRAYAAFNAKRLHFVSESAGVADVQVNHTSQTFRLRHHSLPEGPYHLPLFGAHQLENALAALETTRLFLNSRGKSLQQSKIATGLSGVHINGRMERISDAPEIWIDAGHTPDALDRVSASFLQMFRREQILVVFGVSSSKNAEQMIKIIEARFDRVMLAQAYKNGTTVEALRRLFSNASVIIGQFNRVEDTVRQATKMARNEDFVVLVLGSLYLAVEFRHVIWGKDPQSLAFF